MLSARCSFRYRSPATRSIPFVAPWRKKPYLQFLANPQKHRFLQITELIVKRSYAVTSGERRFVSPLFFFPRRANFFWSASAVGCFLRVAEENSNSILDRTRERIRTNTNDGPIKNGVTVVFRNTAPPSVSLRRPSDVSTYLDFTMGPREHGFTCQVELKWKARYGFMLEERRLFPCKCDRTGAGAVAGAGVS